MPFFIVNKFFVDVNSINYFASVENKPINILYVEKKELVIDAAYYPDSSYKNKTGSLIIGSTRLLFLGILYAGPQQTTTGKIRIVDIPTAQTRISVASISMNLGIVIKSEKLFDFANILGV